MAEVINPIVLHTRKGTPLRVLRPTEYDAIRNAILNENTRLILDLLLYTGARYVELMRLAEHPDWIRESSHTIYLPPEASLKVERQSPDRFIHLSREGWSALTLWQLKIKEPKDEMYTRRGFTKFLKTHAKKAGISEEGLSSKTLRKTFESWLVQALVIQGRQPSALSLIAKSFGHTELTAIGHYINLDFTAQDVEKILARTSGWMGQEV